jgi:GIY-YIG catalytic domain
VSSIYGLYDKSDNLRYIGKANDPAARLKSHMRDCRNRRTPLYDWINKHGVPVMRVIEADCADWREAERRLIAQARADGCRLLNLADGGEEPYCPTEVRQRNGRDTSKAIHSDPFAKRIWELKRGIGCALKDGYVTNAGRAKLRLAASKRPELFGAWAGLPDRAE